MRWRPGPALWLILPLIAVAAFGVLLGFSLLRMVGIESDMRIDAERNMLWVAHQGEVAARRLSEAALLAASGAVGREEVLLRLDILRSRMALMDEGPQREFVEQAGLAGDLARLRAEVEAQAWGVADFTPADGAALHRAMAPVAGFFGRAANMAMIAGWDDLGARLESYRDQLRQIIAGLIGIMAAGGALTVMLVLALRQSRRRNRMLMQARGFSDLLISSSGEGILAVDRDGRCTLWNEAMARLLGQSAATMPGRRLSEAPGILATQKVQQGLAAALAGRETGLSLQPAFRPGSDVPIHVDLRIFPMRDAGRIIGAIIFIQDASDRHAARLHEAAIRARLQDLVAARTQELNEAMLRERSAAELYRNFAAMISHQFRTPLAVADSAMQRLIRRARRLEPDEVALRAGRAREAIAGLTRLVDTTLAAARPDTGAADQTCDPARILRDLCGRHPDGRIKVLVETEGAALGKPAHIEQALENLLSNALRHAVPGTPVRARLHGDAARIFCDIRNAGQPPPAGEHPHLFRRGFRGRNSAGSEGTGTGLFIARSLVRMQGGDVDLLPASTDTIFRLTLSRPRKDLKEAVA